MTDIGFRPVPGNPSLEVALPGVLRNRDGSECTLTYSHNGVEVELYGQKISVCPTKLAYLAYFEVDLGPEYLDRLDDFEFYPINEKIIGDKFFAWLSRPIEFEDGFRLIANHPSYCVNKEGYVKSLKTGNVYRPGNKAEYPVTSLMVRGVVKDVRLHRLIADAWVENPLPGVKIYVNHMDGDKGNNDIDNLEWVTVRENNLHAYNNGMKAACSCRVRDIRTGEVLAFPTVSQACCHMGIQNRVASQLSTVRPQTLIGEFFEVRISTDDRPWFYEGKEAPVRADRYTFTITLPDGTVDVIGGTRELNSKYGIWNDRNARHAAQLFVEKYPDHRIELIDSYDRRVIQCMIVETRYVIETDTIADMSRKVGVHKNTILDQVSRNVQQIIEGKVFRRKSDEPWKEPFTQAPTSAKCILARNATTQEEVKYVSLRKVAEHFDVDRSLIKLRIKNKSEYKGWTFTEI